MVCSGVFCFFNQHLKYTLYYPYLQTGHANPYSTDNQQVVRQELFQLSDATTLQRQLRIILLNR